MYVLNYTENQYVYTRYTSFDKHIPFETFFSRIDFVKRKSSIYIYFFKQLLGRNNFSS